MSEIDTATDQKTVLLGVTSSVAAYKACEIVRGLQKADVRVKVVMTEHATHFIDPTQFRALTREPVAVDLFDNPSDPIHHISLAQEADAFLIAPCTANVIAKLACGIADDLLTTTALATTAPIIIAPAMNVNMYENAATQHNMGVLASRGVRFIDSEVGRLACGDVGKGKLASVDAIVAYTLDVLHVGAEKPLAGKKVLITAGPTVEPIDPVRFISNRSSGKMGYAIAAEAVARGAQVTLVSGPVALMPPHGATVVPVETAVEMLAATEEAFEGADIAIFTAAVADMRPVVYADQKMKKGTDDAALADIALVENPDILATMAARKGDCVIVGFAAETQNVVENAQAKLERKGADMIVANQVGEGRAFGTTDNQVSFVTKDGVESLPLMDKAEVAKALLDKVENLL